MFLGMAILGSESYYYIKLNRSFPNLTKVISNPWLMGFRSYIYLESTIIKYNWEGIGTPTVISKDVLRTITLRNLKNSPMFARNVSYYRSSACIKCCYHQFAENVSQRSFKPFKNIGRTRLTAFAYQLWQPNQTVWIAIRLYCYTQKYLAVSGQLVDMIQGMQT